MSAFDLLRQQMFGGAQPQKYEPTSKMGLAIQGMVDMVTNAAPNNPIVSVIASSSQLVIRKVDEEDPAKSTKLLEAIQAIATAGLDSNITLEQFKTVMADWGGDLKALVA